MSKSVLIIDTPSSCDNCPLCILLDLYRCTVNKRYCGDEQGYFSSNTMPSWCPLKEEKKAIPIEWMYEWRMKNNEQYNVGLSSFSQMISDWEKENES